MFGSLGARCSLNAALEKQECVVFTYRSLGARRSLTEVFADAAYRRWQALRVAAPLGNTGNWPYWEAVPSV